MWFCNIYIIYVCISKKIIVIANFLVIGEVLCFIINLNWKTPHYFKPCSELVSSRIDGKTNKENKISSHTHIHLLQDMYSVNVRHFFDLLTIHNWLIGTSKWEIFRAIRIVRTHRNLLNDLKFKFTKIESCARYRQLFCTIVLLWKIIYELYVGIILR